LAIVFASSAPEPPTVLRDACNTTPRVLLSATFPVASVPTRLPTMSLPLPLSTSIAVLLREITLASITFSSPATRTPVSLLPISSLSVSGLLPMMLPRTSLRSPSIETPSAGAVTIWPFTITNWPFAVITLASSGPDPPTTLSLPTISTPSPVLPQPKSLLLVPSRPT
jgi:hypothetical protein